MSWFGFCSEFGILMKPTFYYTCKSTFFDSLSAARVLSGFYECAYHCFFGCLFIIWLLSHWQGFNSITIRLITDFLFDKHSVSVFWRWPSRHRTLLKQRGLFFLQNTKLIVNCPINDAQKIVSIKRRIFWKWKKTDFRVFVYSLQDASVHF